jgi:hypothetical protein
MIIRGRGATTTVVDVVIVTRGESIRGCRAFSVSLPRDPGRA